MVSWSHMVFWTVFDEPAEFFTNKQRNGTMDRDDSRHWEGPADGLIETSTDHAGPCLGIGKDKYPDGSCRCHRIPLGMLNHMKTTGALGAAQPGSPGRVRT